MVINKAMKKYGVENFIFEIVACCLTLQVANEVEEAIILQEKSHIKYGNGYNVSNGGNVMPPTDENREKLSKALSGKPKSESHKDKLKGKKNSLETRIKISQANKGKIVSLETRQKMSKARKNRIPPMEGKHHSEETKIKLSEINLDKKMSLEAVRKTSEANKIKMIGNTNALGHKVSDEAKAKMSAAKKGRTWKLIDGKRVYSSKEEKE